MIILFREEYTQRKVNGILNTESLWYRKSQYDLKILIDSKEG